MSMIRCSCQGLQGCVPVAPSVTPSFSASARQLRASLGESSARSRRRCRSGPCGPRPRMRSARRRGAPRAPCPRAAALSSSKRFESDSVSGSRIANSSSTATVKSCADSYSVDTPSRRRSCRHGERLREGLEKTLRDALPAPAVDDRAACAASRELGALVRVEGEQPAELSGEVGRVAAREAREVA